MEYLFPTSVLSNQNLNAPGSNYAANYNKDTTKLIALQLREQIYDASPQDFMDLAVLGAKTPETKNSDEFIYFENQYQRAALITPILTTGIAAGTTQVVPIENINQAAPNIVITITSTNQKANIMSVDPNLGTITIKAMTGQTLPAMSSATAYVFSNHTTVDGDSTTNITPSYRLTDLVERYNYIQTLARRTNFGRIEMLKYLNAGTTDYLQANRKQLMNLFRTDISNAYWNGDRGEITLSDNSKAKTSMGIYPAMVNAGSYRISANVANILDAIKSAAFRSRFGTGNYVRFLYGTPEMMDNIAKEVKQPLIRYEATNDKMAELQLDYISLGTSKLVLVPVQRFEASSGSFPSAWERRIFLLDQSSITPVALFGYPERVGKVGSRATNPATMNNYEVEYIEGSISQKFQNPLGSAIIDIN